MRWIYLLLFLIPLATAQITIEGSPSTDSMNIDIDPVDIIQEVTVISDNQSFNQTYTDSLYIRNYTENGYVYKGDFETTSNDFPWSVDDDGSNVLMDFPTLGGNNYFGITTTGGFFQLYANPNAGNDYLLATITETQGADTEINFYEGGTGHNRFWDSGSARFGGGASSLCSNLTTEVDCDTPATGADVVIQDDIWLGGGGFFNDDVDIDSGNIDLGGSLNFSSQSGQINQIEFDFGGDPDFQHFQYVFMNPSGSVYHANFKGATAIDINLTTEGGAVSGANISGIRIIESGTPAGGSNDIFKAIEIQFDETGDNREVIDVVGSGGIEDIGAHLRYKSNNGGGLGIINHTNLLGSGYNWGVLTGEESGGLGYVFASNNLIIQDLIGSLDSNMYILDKDYISDNKGAWFEFNSGADTFTLKGLSGNEPIVIDGTNAKVDLQTSGELEMSGATTLDIDGGVFTLDAAATTINTDETTWNTGSTNSFTLTAGQTCFAENTPITMSDGTDKYIQDIEVGDLVLSYDEQKEEQTASEVVNFMVRESDHYYLLNGHLKVTGEHPFYTKRGWKEVRFLQVGDKLFTESGDWITLNYKQRFEEQIKVYNFEVDNTHTYYANGVLVHNKAAPGDITLTAGEGTASDESGEITIQAGQQTGTGSGGEVLILAGDSSFFNGGEVNIAGGLGGIGNGLVEIGSCADNHLTGQEDLNICGALEVNSLSYFDDDLLFYNEIRPDGTLCSSGDVLIKAAADDWDCINNESIGGGGGGGTFDNSTLWELSSDVVQLANTSHTVTVQTNLTVTDTLNATNLILNPPRLSVTTTSNSNDILRVNPFNSGNYTTYTYVNNSVPNNIDYNPSTGLFNVTVDGTYSIFLTMIVQQNANDDIWINLTENGGQIYAANWYVHNSVEPAPFSVNLFRDLSAGDLLEVIIQGTGQTEQARQGTTFTIHRIAT